MTEPAYDRRSDVIFEDFDDHLLVSSATGRWFTLTGSACLLWRSLAQPRTVSQLLECCQREFDGDAETMERDISRTLREWEDNGLCVRV